MSLLPWKLLEMMILTIAETILAETGSVFSWIALLLSGTARPSTEHQRVGPLTGEQVLVSQGDKPCEGQKVGVKGSCQAQSWVGTTGQSWAEGWALAAQPRLQSCPEHRARCPMARTTLERPGA